MLDAIKMGFLEEKQRKLQKRKEAELRKSDEIESKKPKIRFQHGSLRFPHFA